MAESRRISGITLPEALQERVRRVFPGRRWLTPICDLLVEPWPS